MKSKARSLSKIFCVLIAVLMMIPPFTVSAKSNFSVGQDAIDLIKETEGFSPTKYWDYKQYSIGYGTACGANDYPNGITKAEAEKELKRFAAAFGTCVNNFANKYNIKLTQNQFDALVCLTYALGDLWTAYDTFQLKTILINGSEKYSFLDIAQGFGEWRVAGGKIAPGLVRRRQKEIQLFLKNRTDPTSEVYRVNTDGGLNLRASASPSATKTGSMKNYTIFAVTEKTKGTDGSEWGKTKYEGKEHWVSLAYCVSYVGGPLPIDGKPVTTTPGSTSDEPASSYETWQITSSDGVWFRSGPGTNYSKITLLDKGTQINVTEKIKGEGYQWGKSKVNGTEGWCVLDYAKLISKQEIPGATLKSIRIDSKPKKTEYLEGEKLDTDGLTVMAVYSDASEQKITDYDISGYEPKAGTYNVKVTYMKKTASFTVTVKPKTLTAIKIESPPKKTLYKTGEGLSLDGLKVTGTYEGGTEGEVTDFYLEGVDGFSKEAGEKTITVKAGDFKTTFKVEVTEKNLTGIKVTNPPEVTEYAVGQELITDGLVVHAVFDNGRKNAVSLSDCTITGYDPQKLGEQTVIVTYNDYKATFKVNVLEPDESELAGDLDGSGTRDIFDLMLLNKYLNGNTEFDKKRMYLTDVNLDGSTNEEDVEALSRIVSEQ